MIAQGFADDNSSNASKWGADLWLKRTAVVQDQGFAAAEYESSAHVDGNWGVQPLRFWSVGARRNNAAARNASES